MYNQNPSDNINGKTYADKTPYHKEYITGMNRKLTNRNPYLFTPELYRKISNKLDIEISGADENALWLTSYAYDFFYYLC